MSKPVFAIVGRPNVGKSTLFNKLIGERRSIVEDTPGVTRDRIYGEGEWCGRRFTLIDTGGIELRSEDVILKQMRVQAQLAMEAADVIFFLCVRKPGFQGSSKKTGQSEQFASTARLHFLFQICTNDIYRFFIHVFRFQVISGI